MWDIAGHITDEAAIREKAEDILDTFDIAPGKDGKQLLLRQSGIWQDML